MKLQIGGADSSLGNLTPSFPSPCGDLVMKHPAEEAIFPGLLRPASFRPLAGIWL